MHKEHQHEYAAEGNDDGGAGGRIQNHTEITAQGGDECSHGPADGEARADAVRKEHGADAGDDEIAENQQDAGDGDGRSHYKTERSVEEKIPEADVEAGLLSFCVIHGDGQEFFAEDIVEDADGAVENGGFFHFGPGDGEDIADEHVFQVLGLTGSLAHQKNRAGGSNSVSDADKGFLGNVAAAAAREREDRGPEERKPQADPVGASAVGVHSGNDGDSGAERGDLREREVHEDDAAFHDVDAEIGVNPCKNKARYKSGQQEFQHRDFISFEPASNSFLNIQRGIRISGWFRKPA